MTPAQQGLGALDPPGRQPDNGLIHHHEFVVLDRPDLDLGGAYRAIGELVERLGGPGEWEKWTEGG